SVASLTFGAKRIAAENAAYKGSGAPQCIPPHLGLSDILPGTHLAVSPLPDSLDSSYETQISFLGYPASALSSISVDGAASGGHSGRLEAYSQGDGASFVPSKAFQPGETVVVHGKLTVAGHTTSFAFHFTTAIRDPIGHPASTPKPAGKASELLAFHSRPELHPPVVTVTASSPLEAPGDLFLAPYSGPGQDGPMIVDSAGNLVWFDPLPSGTESTDLQVQQYEGKPVLTWWQGYIPPQGFGQGEDVITDSSYHQILRMRAGNGLLADLHEFKITPQNTALVTVFDPIRCNLSSIGGPRNAAVTDSLFQEIDLKTHLVRREWHPLDHVALSQSDASATSSSEEWPYDYFHLNSIDPLRNGSTLISSRNTSALYELSPSTGQVIAQIGGKHGSEKLGAGTSTAYQHDAEELPNGDFSIFDNGGVPKVHPQSRGLIVSVDPTTKTETLVDEYEHSKPLSAGSQGNIQLLENGDMFIGWGAEPYFSEYTASGALVFDAHLPAKTQSYRSYRFPWSGTPSGGPSVAAAPGAGDTVTVYASWNGATNVASWRVLTGASTAQLAATASAPRAGFETSISTPGKPAYVAVQALDAAGNLLGTSHAIKG
ncbi:MAG TPA: arylsulfotransferase family protein, partial [Solirubrobacteraceae bacterium]|nr:arylsulfotransferase family protein [Solirubrobacteraceae bacterium]